MGSRFSKLERRLNPSRRHHRPVRPRRSYSITTRASSSLSSSSDPLPAYESFEEDAPPAYSDFPPVQPRSHSYPSHTSMSTTPSTNPWARPEDEELIPPHRAITAFDTPQWLWSNAQCREWLTEVMVELGGKEREWAIHEAESFDGFGPLLFSTTVQEWTSKWGNLGRCIFNLIMSLRAEEVGLPKSVMRTNFSVHLDGRGLPPPSRREDAGEVPIGVAI